MPIYGWGALLITLVTYRFKDKPWLVFIINCVLTGSLEYLTGYVLLKNGGIRLWDYNTEIWNWGNINGFICARSILFFGLSSIFLIYTLIPFLIKISQKMAERKFMICSYFLGITYLIDIIIYQILS